VSGPLTTLPVESLPGMCVRAVAVELPCALEALPAPDWLAALLAAYAAAPLRPDEALRTAVRGMLRQRGYRPTGRGKPSSEYLAGAAREGRLAPINAIVDAGNAVSLHSGLPISVVDLDRTQAPLRIAVAAAGATYAFNRSGQQIDVGGLPCLFDAEGPCANAVKDAQRTKTDAATVRVLAIVWGLLGPHAAHTERTAVWLDEVFTRLGAKVREVVTG
jgi:DNA/RNA-binding domain of Phe-tRNA-synthetase-like protein